MSKTSKLKHCSGCENDFYNGNNPLGVEKCWSLEKASLVLRKKIHVDQKPPFTQKPIQVLDCYHQKRYVFWDPKNC